MWYVKAYFRLLFGRVMWTNIFPYLLIGLAIYGVCQVEPEQRVSQAIRGSVLTIFVLMLFTLIGMLMGLAKQKWGKK